MLILLSPSKTLDLGASDCNDIFSLPVHSLEANELMGLLKKYTPLKLMTSMKVSKGLASTVYSWHTEWKNHKTIKSATKSNAKACAFAMKGEAFKFLDASSLSKDALSYAQENLIILSGLYGILRPCDLIMPYRLEMGQTFQISQEHKTLNSFWAPIYKKVFTKKVNLSSSNFILNLASDEYSKVVFKAGISSEIITCHFKEESEKGFKSVSTYAKQARGSMAQFVIKNQIQNVEKLKSFNNLSYTFNHDLSASNNLVFTRPLINKK